MQFSDNSKGEKDECLLGSSLLPYSLGRFHGTMSQDLSLAVAMYTQHVLYDSKILLNVLFIYLESPHKNRTKRMKRNMSGFVPDIQRCIRFSHVTGSVFMPRFRLFMRLSHI